LHVHREELPTLQSRGFGYEAVAGFLMRVYWSFQNLGDVTAFKK